MSHACIKRLHFYKYITVYSSFSYPWIDKVDTCQDSVLKETKIINN